MKSSTSGVAELNTLSSVIEYQKHANRLLHAFLQMN